MHMVIMQLGAQETEPLAVDLIPTAWRLGRCSASSWSTDMRTCRQDVDFTLELFSHETR